MAERSTPTKPFDVADYIRAPEDAAAYLAEALQNGDETEFRRALGAIARSRSMAEIAEKAGLGRESFFVSASSNPTRSS